MKVKLLAYTPEPEKVIAIAARLCYSNKANIDTIAEGFTKEEIDKFIGQLISSGHSSTLEHCSFSFGIEGISRTVSHELCRHRIGIAISQRSQRYCAEGECDFIYPLGYTNNTEKAIDIYEASVANSKQDYKDLLEQGIPKEIARYVLPNATATRMVVTMNARELMHFCALRACKRSQPEMQELARAIIQVVKPVAPTLFKKLGPSCVQLGYCPEGSKCCGRAPTLNKLLEVYKVQKNAASTNG